MKLSFFSALENLDVKKHQL